MDERKIVNGFYECVRRTFFMCRIAGYLPIIGLLNKEAKLSRFVWLSLYSIYCMIGLSSMITFAWFNFRFAILHSTGFRDIGGLIFRCFAIVSSFLLIRFSMTWETMRKDIEDIERLLPSFKNPQRIIKSINLVMFFIFILGSVNHLFQILVSIRMTLLFYVKEDDVFTLELYYTTYYRWLFHNVNFHYATAFIFQFTKLQMCFTYYVIDTLVILVTLYLVCRFRNFNRIVKMRQKTCANRNVLWMDLQAHYTRLTRLVRVIDDHINPFVFLSFLSNLIFLCKMIYDTIQLRSWTFVRNEWIIIGDAICNTVFLVLRIASVSILTAHLHTLSREPLKLLHTLPDSAYTLEVQRFMDQVYHSKVNLSGFGMFHITRGTILLMLSTIITYELVLLQLPLIY